MKNSKIITLKELIREWAKVNCSITLHIVNDRLFINAKTKSDHTIVIPHHKNMYQILVEYPYLEKALTSYTLDISILDYNFIGELYYLEINSKKQLKKDLIKIRTDKKLENLFLQMNEDIKETFISLEESFLYHQEDILEVYKSPIGLESFFVSKRDNCWNGSQKFIDKFEFFFPTIKNSIKDNESLFIEKIIETKMFSVEIGKFKIVGSTIFEAFDALEKSMKQKQELGMERKLKKVE